MGIGLGVGLGDGVGDGLGDGLGHGLGGCLGLGGVGLTIRNVVGSFWLCQGFLDLALTSGDGKHTLYHHTTGNRWTC